MYLRLKMRVQQFRFCGMDMTVHSFNTVIVGTGAAGYSAAERLYQYGPVSYTHLDVYKRQLQASPEVHGFIWQNVSRGG